MYSGGFVEVARRIYRLYVLALSITTLQRGRGPLRLVVVDVAALSVVVGVAVAGSKLHLSRRTYTHKSNLIFTYTHTFMRTSLSPAAFAQSNKIFPVYFSILSARHTTLCALPVA